MGRPPSPVLGERWTKKIYNWKTPEGTKTGRPRCFWNDQMKHAMDNQNLTEENALN